ncbi:hypothetical protein OHA98_36400 [Streptomyces sp. NBC_00654]|uniref:hypothetical protein n=1 Tax=Streptomyces sp. NBC_00654 TaxID=2975799 RepID=UPI002253990E|nr:hypothetical protein [Streptomyces sp. NBC_00654]MCX4970144.1 hypothetical protein [Streptomyces sp. NBC_00654]
MQLNQLAQATEGGAPDLASNPAEKQQAAKAINDDLERDVERDGKHATESVNAAVKECGARDGYGWDTHSTYAAAAPLSPRT